MWLLMKYHFEIIQEHFQIKNSQKLSKFAMAAHNKWHYLGIFVQISITFCSKVNLPIKLMKWEFLNGALHFCSQKIVAARAVFVSQNQFSRIAKLWSLCHKNYSVGFNFWGTKVYCINLESWDHVLFAAKHYFEIQKHILTKKGWSISK